MLPIRDVEIPIYARGLVDRAVETRADFPLAATLTLPGVTAEIRGSGPLPRAARHNLASVSGADGLARDPLELFLAHADLPGWAPPAALAEPVPPAGVIAELLAASGLAGCVNGDSGLWYVLDPSRGVGVQLMRTSDGFPPWEPGAPFRLFLHWHYARRGLRLAHAGTLGHNGDGVLLAGAGGAGKSGTVISGLLAGLTTVGDDYVLLAHDADGVVARPLFRTLKQDPEGLKRLGLAPPGDGAVNWQGKHQFQVADLAPDGLVDRLTIGAILLPTVTGARRTSIAPVARREAMLALALSASAQLLGDFESGFRFFGGVTRHLPCYRLDLGADARDVAETIADFLAGGRP